MKNGVVYTLAYMFFMILTYLWRISAFSAMKESADNFDNLVFAANIALFINYIILIAIAYSRGKKVDKKYIVIFPIIAGLFDVILAFIPLVPTVMNIIAIVSGVSGNKVVYVVQQSEQKETKKVTKKTNKKTTKKDK